MDESSHMSVIEVILLDCEDDSVHRVSAIETMNWYGMLNPPTGSVYLVHFRAFERLVTCCQI